MSVSSPHKPQSLKEVWLAIVGLSGVFLFGMLDNSILNIALPTIARELHTSATVLPWITNAYALVFGAFMLAFGAMADRFGRRRMMLVGLSLLALASFLTVFVHGPGELIAVRVGMGVAAAMTAPGTIALAFRLFEDNALRIRTISLITTVGLVGLAAGPVFGGLLLSFLPWQALLLINVPIAIVAWVGIRFGLAPEQPHELHPAPLDIPGTLLGTLAILLFIASPSLFIVYGYGSWLPWVSGLGALGFCLLFLIRQRTARNPLVDGKLVGQSLVSSGLAYKAAASLALSGLGYMVTLQLQLDWGWSPLMASLGMCPLVVTLLLVGFVVEKFVTKVGMQMASWLGSLSVLAALVVYATLGTFTYGFVALSLVCIAAGLRVVGVVAGVNVMNGTPKTRTSMGAALVDTTDQITSVLGVAVCGTILAALFPGDLAHGNWSVPQAAAFHHGVFLGTLVLAAVAVVLVGWASWRIKRD